MVIWEIHKQKAIIARKRNEKNGERGEPQSGEIDFLQAKLSLKMKGEGRMKETKKQIIDIIYKELDP